MTSIHVADVRNVMDTTQEELLAFWEKLFWDIFQLSATQRVLYWYEEMIAMPQVRGVL